MEHEYEYPSIPAVYRVKITLPNGEVRGGDGQEKIYAYYDGVDTWYGWEFTIYDAYRAKPLPKDVKFEWRGKPL